MSRRYLLRRLPGLALGVGLPVGISMLILLNDGMVRRDVGLLVTVAMIVVLSWVGGIWPGLVATILFAIAFAGPVGTEHFNPPLDDLSLFLFVSAGLIGTGVVEAQHRARWRIEAARDRARISRRAEHAVRAELESIVAAIGEGIIVADVYGTISLMNQAARDLVGTRVDHFSDIAREFVSSDEAPTPGQLLADEGASTAEFALKADGRRVALQTFPLKTEGEADRRILLLRDVTEERRRERLRDAFLGLLSHELRTPMTAVYGGATLLQRIGDRLDAQTRQELREDIVTEADRLSRLLDDLLVLTRLEDGGEVGREPALLQHLVAEVADQRTGSAKRSTIEVTVEPDLPPVIGDETSIRQVTHNLISNALKYSPPGSPIEVRVKAEGDGEVAVRVLDRGPGLAGSDAEVFDLFFRAPATERTASGLGIGLFVCRRLVEAMRGRIWTRPREGGGSEFGFALNTWPIDEEIVEGEAEVGEVAPVTGVAEVTAVAGAPEPNHELVVSRRSTGPRW